MRSGKLRVAPYLLILSLLSLVRADCDYDDDWCCDPRSWCEALHFALFQFLFGFAFYCVLGTFLSQAKLARLAREMIQTGRAILAKVVAVQSKRLTTEEAPFTSLEHAALVEFQSPTRDLVLKWVKITEADFQEILGVAVLPTITKEAEHYFTSVTEARLRSLSTTRGRTRQLMIYHWPTYPKSAVSSDVRSVAFPIAMKVFYSVLALFLAAVMMFLFGWFFQTYNYNLSQAGAKFLVLVVVQIHAVGFVWIMFALLETFEKERNFILKDHVRVVGGVGKSDNDAGYGPVGEVDTPLLPSMV